MLLFKKISFWLSLAGLVSAAVLIVKMRASITEPVPASPIAAPVKPFASALGASGIIEATHENTAIGVPVSGLITQVKVAVSAKVKAGEPLLQLDDRELRATLISQKAQIRVVSAQLQRVRDQLSRLEAIDDPRAVAADDLKNRRNDVAVAGAQLEAAEAAVLQTETLLARLTVTSPIDGTVLQVNVRPGEFANPASAVPPLIVGNIDELQVRADVDEQIAPRVKPGSRAVGYIKGDTSHPLPLEFVRIEPFVIPKKSLTGASVERVDTRVLQIIYRFPAQDRPIYVGQQIDLYIEE